MQQGVHDEAEALEPDRPVALRAEAARALGELGTPTAASALAAVLGDRQFEVAHQAARALLRLGKAGRAALVEAVTLPAAAHTSEALAAAHAREALAVAELDEQRRRAPAS